MDIFWLIVSFVFILLGIIGSFLPIIPGAITSWIGLFFVYKISYIESDWTFLIITLIIALVVFLMDYILPSLGAKKYGGTKAGIIGTTIGLIAGIFFLGAFLGPFAIVIGPFLGAYIGELIRSPKDKKRALRAAFGSFIGFLSGTVLKFVLGITYLFLYLKILLKHKEFIF